MDVIERLELGLQFLKANAWGQGADKQECPEGYAYCARGALIYGAFADVTEHAWCPDRADWHKGPCVDVEDVCDNSEYTPLSEWYDACDALDAGAEAIEGRWMLSVEYNDALGRTKDDVIRMFEAAIKQAKAAA